MLDIDEAKQAIRSFQALLDQTSGGESHLRISPDAWTLSEIVGHLIDSASNNHQRFVRLRFENLKDYPGYDAEPWVASQKYDQFDFESLSTLWTSFNALLLHLAESMSHDVLQNTWETSEGKLTLEFLVEDYYRHLRLHTEHYKKRRTEVLEKMEA